MHDDSDLTDDEPHDPTNRKPWLPTPAEIWASCREIRETWDAREFEKRAPHWAIRPIELRPVVTHDR